jgi:serine/threonine-protein kinase
MGVLAREIEATYEILAKMGEGGMGAVYKVRHRFFDEIRVIKVMQAQIEAVDELKERFLGEAKRGKQLRHPNLAEVIDFSIAADGTSYIVMEFIEGANLRELTLCNGGPLDYHRLVPIAEQALAALGFLHSRKFVHRDISPDNIMVTGDGTVKLIDLGVAKSLDATNSLTMAGQFIGKVQYASPEQFGGDVDARSDIYSLGVVLYEALTGVKPIVGKDPMSIIAGHLQHPPRSFEETDARHLVPQAVRAAVLKTLEKRPQDRFQTAAEFAAALRATLAPEEQRTVTVPLVTKPAEFISSAVTVPPTRVEDVRTEVTMQPRTEVEPRTEVDLPTEVSVARGSRRWMGIAAIVAVLFLGGIAAVWLRSSNAPRPVAAVEATVSNTMVPGTSMTVSAAPVPAVASVETGQLLINALPWGSVTSVTDAAGTERLSSASETPLMLSLPPGSYKVRLSNPNSNRSVVLDATVTANALSRCEAELDRVDAASYVDRIGIGR